MAIKAPDLQVRFERFGQRPGKTMHSTLAQIQRAYYKMELHDFDLMAKMAIVRRNFSHATVRGAVLEGYRMSKDKVVKELKTIVPKKQRRGNKQWGSKASRSGLSSAYPPSHRNNWKYGRRGGETRRSVKFRLAKPPPGFIPDFMVRIDAFPWRFLRRGTKQRWTGRRGPPVIYTGKVPNRLGRKHSAWARRTHAYVQANIHVALERYSGMREPWKPKPKPPSSGLGPLFD